MNPAKKKVFLYEMAKKEKIKNLKKAISKLQILYLSIKSNLTQSTPKMPEIELQSIASALIFVLWQHLNSSSISLYGIFLVQKNLISINQVDINSPEFITEIQRYIWSLPSKNPAFKWAQTIHSLANYIRHFEEWQYCMHQYFLKNHTIIPGIISYSKKNLHELINNSPQKKIYIRNINTLINSGMDPSEFLILGLNAAYAVDLLELANWEKVNLDFSQYLKAMEMTLFD